MGQECLFIHQSVVEKNHPGGPSTSDQYTYDNRIYDCQFGDHSLLSLIKLYLSKLHPECTWLFQQHRTRALCTDNVWFKKEPLGINLIGKMMPNISKEAGLSRTYTNHSVYSRHNHNHHQALHRRNIDCPAETTRVMDDTKRNFHGEPGPDAADRSCRKPRAAIARRQAEWCHIWSIQ